MEEMGEDWDNCCPLCMEEMDSTDRQLKPCQCGYEICVWCWNHIMEMAEKDNTEGRCPACRTAYNRDKIVATASKPVDINERKQKSGKSKLKSAEGRKNLSNVRVIQRKLVYVVGIPTPFADEETLERKEYFGQYGKILKISIAKLSGNSSQHSSSSTSPSIGVYVTYMKEEDALRCIEAVNGCILEGKVLKACFGTTKYCNSWLKHMPCSNPECLYLHDEGTREDSFTKEEMLAKYGSKNQYFHELTHPPSLRSGLGLPPPMEASSLPSTSGTLTSSSVAPISHTSSTPGYLLKSSMAGSAGKSSSLPAAASWGSRSNFSSSRLTSTGKSGAGTATMKPKAGVGMLTTNSSLLTVPGSGQPIQIPYVHNHGGIKSNDTDEAQTVAPMQLASSHSAGDLETKDCLPGLDTSNIDIEFPMPVSNMAASHSRNFSDLDINDLDDIREESKLDSSSDSVRDQISDSRDNDLRATALIERETSQVATVLENCASSRGAVILNNNSSKDIEVMIETNVSPYGSPNISSQLYSDAETSNHISENGLRLEMDNCNLHPDTHDTFLESSLHTFQASSTGGGLTALLNDDQDSINLLNTQIEENSTFQKRVLSEDSCSDSATREHLSMLMKDDKEHLSRNSLCVEERLGNLERHQVSEKVINGLMEHELITDMFATGFDLWTDGNPQDLAQLLFNGKNVEPPPEIHLQETFPSWKPSGTGQSRFRFARQDDATAEVLTDNGDFQAMENVRYHRLINSSVSSTSDDFSTGESFRNKVLYSGESSVQSSLSNSRSTVSAPPGFSAIRASAVPPPGFSQNSRSMDSRKLPESSQYPSRPVAVSSIYSQSESTNTITHDVEFIDPAIMAVGRGKLQSVTRSTMPFIGSSSGQTSVSQTTPLSQQARLIDYDSSCQPNHEGTYINYGSMNSISSQTGFLNQDHDSLLPSLFHSSLNESINHQRLPGQYHNATFQRGLQDSVYGNGTAKTRFQPTFWEDWNIIPEVNSTGQQSVNDMVGQSAVPHMSLDRVPQSLLEELSRNKSRYFADTSFHDDQGPSRVGPFSSTRGGQYYH